MFLEEVLRYINNRFERGFQAGTFRLGAGFTPDGILDGQYYWVEGSVLNDGLHLHPDRGLTDEEFTGRIVALAVPRPLVDLVDEIETWMDENAKAISSPYASESFGGYSYTKAAAAQQASQDGTLSPWQAQFGARLRQYRKLNRNWA